MNFNISAAPRFSSDANWFRVVLPNLNYAVTGNNQRKSSGKSSGKSSEKIVDLIRSNPHITIPEMADSIEISTRAVEKQIAKLQKAGRIRREGSAKSGYWVELS